MGFGKISWKGVIQIRWDGEAYPLSGGKYWSTGNGKEVIMSRMDYKSDLRFAGIKPFAGKVWLSSPTMHGGEQMYVDEAIRTNWVSTVGENINEVERLTAKKAGRSYAVALSSGTAALHLGVRLCGEKLYGHPREGGARWMGRRYFARF